MSESSNIPLKGLHPTDFQHPLDEEATEGLKNVKGLDWFTEKVMDLGFERMQRVLKLGSCLKIDDNQVPTLYKKYQGIAEMLDMEPPELFIENSPITNAYTYGFTSPYVVITTGLLDNFSDEETNFIIGHELGHVKCGHTLYNTMASYIQILIQMISAATLGVGSPIVKGVSMGIQLALLEWSRKAEFSADRAGLLSV